MYTPTLGEVRTAISTNNRKQAVSMLQTLIQKKPSADAWYLAAKLTTNHHKKVQYLRAALLLDNKHYKSLNYLRELGENSGGVQTLILGSFTDLLLQQASKSPLLRNLSPRVQLAVWANIFVVLIVVMGIFVSSLASLHGPAISSQGPSTPVIENITRTNILNHFYASNLDILSTAQIRDEQVGKDIISLDIRDIGNRSRTLEIFVYDSVKAILSDQATLANYEQSANVIAYANIILVYPLEMSDVSVADITQVFETIQN